MAKAKVVEPEHYPAYDGTQDGEALVYGERFCSCGGLTRVRGRAVQVSRWLFDFDEKHVADKTKPCTYVSKAACLAEREALRRAAFAEQGRLDEYEPRAYPNINTEG